MAKLGAFNVINVLHVVNNFVKEKELNLMFFGKNTHKENKPISSLHQNIIVH